MGVAHLGTEPWEGRIRKLGQQKIHLSPLWKQGGALPCLWEAGGRGGRVIFHPPDLSLHSKARGKEMGLWATLGPLQGWERAKWNPAALCRDPVRGSLLRPACASLDRWPEGRAPSGSGPSSYSPADLPGGKVNIPKLGPHPSALRENTSFLPKRVLFPSSFTSHRVFWVFHSSTLFPCSGPPTGIVGAAAWPCLGVWGGAILDGWGMAGDGRPRAGSGSSSGSQLCLCWDNWAQVSLTESPRLGMPQSSKWLLVTQLQPSFPVSERSAHDELGSIHIKLSFPSDFFVSQIPIWLPYYTPSPCSPLAVPPYIHKYP